VRGRGEENKHLVHEQDELRVREERGATDRFPEVDGILLRVMRELGAWGVIHVGGTHEAVDALVLV